MSDRYWSEDSRKIYSDGSFEVLWGEYQQNLNKVLGLHWCDSNESYACPKLYGGALGWLVVPPFLTLPILNSILSIIKTNPLSGDVAEIAWAIKEFAEQERLVEKKGCDK